MSEYTNTRETIGEQAALDGLIGHTLTEYVDTEVTQLGQYAFYKNNIIQSVKLPNVTAVPNYAFQDCTELVTADLSGMMSVGQYGFSGCSKLENIDLTNVTTLSNYAFQNCSSLKQVNLPDVGSIPRSCFTGCGKAQWFKIATNKTSVISLSRNDAFNNTGRALIFVPDDLVSSYKSASNWSNFASKIYGIGDFATAPIWDETEITDSWDTIATKIGNGTATSSYKLGNYKTIDLGTEGTVRAQIIAVNSDELSGSTDKATFTWLLMECLTNTHKMNSTNTTIGGWKESGMRGYLSTTILALLPATLQSLIKEVKKYSDSYDSNSTKVANELTTDKLWVPSAYEIYGGSSYETSGVTYASVFPSDSTRIRYKGTSAGYWWLRSAYSTSDFRVVAGGGTFYTSTASTTYGVVFGFCT